MKPMKTMLVSGFPLRMTWSKKLKRYVVAKNQKPKMNKLKLGLKDRIIMDQAEEIKKLKLEVERLNSESIEQMGLAQDGEAALQEALTEFEVYKQTTDRLIEKLTTINLLFEVELAERKASALKDALTSTLEAIQ